MGWVRMRFQGQPVLVRVDDAGHVVVDAGRRAEMKYRQGDARSYRPALANLTPDTDGDAEPPARAPASPATPRVKTAADLDAIDVWTDGACSGNPGPMGIGVVVVDRGQRHELGDYLGVGTNNIAELVAIERGLALARQLAPAGERLIRVYSDSGYALGLLGKGWKAKANQELVARLRARVSVIPRIEWIKVAGHAGVPENERCDELARAAIRQAAP